MTTVYLESNAKKNTDNSQEITGHKKLLYDFIANNSGVSRKEINDYMYPLYDTNDQKELNEKVRYLLTALRKEGMIKNVGIDSNPIWIRRWVWENHREPQTSTDQTLDRKEH